MGWRMAVRVTDLTDNKEALLGKRVFRPAGNGLIAGTNLCSEETSDPSQATA